MAVKIRLKRFGKIRAPHYRVVVMDAKKKRDGRAIEEIGKYHPTEEPSLIDIDSARVQYWLSVGAQPSEQVAALLRVTGDWQQVKGLDGAEGTLRTKEPAPEAAAEQRTAAIQSAEDEAEKRKARAAEAAEDNKEASESDKEAAEESADQDDEAADAR